MNKIQLELIDAYSYLVDIIRCVRKNEPLPFTKYFLWGSRKSGKSVSIHYIIIMCLLLDLDITIYMFRNLKKDVKTSIWNDIINILKEIEAVGDFKINYSDRTIKANKCYFRADGLHTQKTDEIAWKANEQVLTTYCLIIDEEAYEIKEQDASARDFAIRGKRLKHKASLYLTNPDSVKNYLIKRLETELPANENILKTNGQQIKKTDKHLYHRANWRINPYVNSDETWKDELDWLWKINPELAKVWDYGLAGITGNGIFTHLLKNIKYINKNRIVNNFVNHKRTIEIWGGLDFGIKKDAFACVIGFRENKETTIYDTFYHENKNVGLDHEQVALKCIGWLKTALEPLGGIHSNYIDIKCDYADYAFMEIMNKTIHKLNIHTINFVPCKKPPLDMAYMNIQALLSSGDLYWTKQTNNNILMVELQSAKWDEAKESLKPVDRDNHSLDAFRYGVWDYIADIDIKKFKLGE